MRPVFDNLPIVLVMAAALLMVGWAGFGEAQRVLPTLEIQRFAAEGKILRDPIERFLRAGQPLAQYTGFVPEAEALRDTDPRIQAVTLVAADGRLMAAVGRAPGLFVLSGLLAEDDQIQVTETGHHYRIHLPIQGRFRSAGELRIIIQADPIHDHIAQGFQTVQWVGMGCLLLFILAIVLAETALHHRRRRVTKTAFLVLFLVQSATVLAVNFEMILDGVTSRTESVAALMAERLAEIGELGLELESIGALPRSFDHFRDINPEIVDVALLAAGKVVIHPDVERIGQVFRVPGHLLDFMVPTRVGSQTMTLNVVVTTPIEAVLARLWRSGKTLLVLLIATGLVALLFLDVSDALERRQRAEAALARHEDGTGLLTLMRPAAFLVVFADMLSVSFLPQMVAEATRLAGLDISLASLPFTAYFLAGALAFALAAPLADRIGYHRLIGGGMAVAATGLLAIALAPEFITLLAGRTASGLGQGAIAAGIGAYLAAGVPARHHTQAMALTVVAANAALIAGGAIGGLLATYLSAVQVFEIAAALGVTALVYLILAVPRVAAPADGPDQSGPFAGIGRVLRDRDFAAALGAIGLVSGMVTSGLVVFGLPLLLAALDLAQDDIGQTLMLYAGAVMLAARITAGLVDRAGGARRVLAFGSTLGGLGTLLVAWIVALDSGGEKGPDPSSWLDSLPLPPVEMIALAAGVVLLGAGRGLVAAPAYIYAAATRAGRAVGRNQTMSLYQALEQGGLVLGPTVVAQLYALSGSGATTTAWLGAALLLGALIFLALGSARPTARQNKS